MCESCNYLSGKHHPDCLYFPTEPVAIIDPVNPIKEAKKDAWEECVHWFALLGPLNYHDRINMNVILEAEEANPYDEW